jgi:hypothetical protein
VVEGTVAGDHPSHASMAQASCCQVQSPLISKAFAPLTSTVSGPVKLLLSLMSLVSDVLADHVHAARADLDRLALRVHGRRNGGGDRGCRSRGLLGLGDGDSRSRSCAAAAAFRRSGADTTRDEEGGDSNNPG